MATYKKRKVICDLVIMEGATSKKGTLYNQCYIELPWEYGRIKMAPLRFCDEQELSTYKAIFGRYDIMKNMKDIGETGLKAVTEDSDNK